MKQILAAFLLLLSLAVSAQSVDEHYTPVTDSVRIGQKEFLPGQQRGTTVILPEGAAVRGVILFLEENRPDLSNTKSLIHPEAAKAGFAVVYVSTGIPADFYFGTRSLAWVDSTIASLFSRNDLKGKPVFLVGAGMSGHRALRYINYLQNGARFRPNLHGLVLCESAIDWVRQWYEEAKAVRDNFHPGSVFEGRMVTWLLEQHLKGTPKNRLQAYLDFSGYSYFDEKNRKLDALKNLRVRTYSEPASDYWMNERGKGSFDTNFPDMVGIITELKLKGHKDAELISFYQDKSLKDRRNPNYTWGLVDKTDLVSWLEKGLR